MDEGWLRFHPHPSRPKFSVPQGAVDAHCHVFGPGAVFPYAAERKYTPCDAPKETLWALRDYLGFERNVIVQATCHGTDNRALVDALRDADGRARGVAAVRQDVTDDELDRLNAAGVRGVRFSFLKRLVEALPHATLIHIAERVAALGWHVVLYFDSHDLPELYELLSALPGIVVIDHLGRADVSKSANGSEFELFVALMKENENIYTKVGCPERLTRQGPPGYDDVVPFAKRLVEAFPERVLWGTDWPHPNLQSHMPDDGQLVDYIPRIATTLALQQRLLVDNPLRLYWPEDAH